MTTPLCITRGGRNTRQTNSIPCKEKSAKGRTWIYNLKLLKPLHKTRMNYRPDIDGLRALAVIPVVLFHAGWAGFSGGYVGVDVFFVISGYLITRLIYDEMNTGRFSVARFYERRIRRIFPALFAVLTASTVAAAFWFMPVDFDAFSNSLAGAALSVSNFVFWREDGYFAGPSDLKPLLHTWSLGIEEQFYVAFPLVLVALHRHARRFLPAALTAAVLASFTLSVWATRHHAGAAFYLLPFRAWELGLGALLAIGIVPALKRRVVAELLSAAGLLLILMPVFSYTPETRFPGWAALPPTLGAALLIYAAPQAAVIGSMLRLRPLVFIGLLSYSLYLWHWPLIVFTRYRLPADLDFATSCMLVLGSLAAAYASWRWIEQPFRRASAPSRRRAVYTAGGAAVAATVAFAAVGTLTAGLPQRLSPEAQLYAAMLDKHKYFGIYDRGTCFLDYDQSAEDYDAAKCLAADRPGGVLIYGDSFAAHLFPGLRALDGAEAVRQYTATSCRPIRTANERCNAFHNRFLTEILPQSRASTIVLSAFWAPYFNRLGAAEFKSRVAATVDAIQAAGKLTVLIGQTPTYHRPVPYTLALAGHAMNRLPARDAHLTNAVLRDIAQQAGALFLDPYAVACDQFTCVAAQDGKPFHWDFGHFTLEGSKFYAKHITQTFASASPSE